MITVELLKAIAPKARYAEVLAGPLNKYLPKYQINTPGRIAHFLAQAAHESGGFRFMREIWGPTPAQTRYEGRRDLGNTIKGDGKRFMGRGIFQITGRANYVTYSQRIGVDIVASPALAETPDIAVAIACEYWKAHNLNALADTGDIKAITKRINGGYNGLADRQRYLARALKALATQAPQKPVQAPEPAPAPEIPPKPSTGKTGAVVATGGAAGGAAVAAQSMGLSWPTILAIAAGVAVAGLIIFILMKRRQSL